MKSINQRQRVRFYIKKINFMKCLKLAFIYKKPDTLRYVTFLYTKSHILRKKQDNFYYVFIYKNLDTFF